jgi:hypothetical protein
MNPSEKILKRRIFYTYNLKIKLFIKLSLLFKIIMSFFSFLTSRKIKSSRAYNKKIFLVLILTVFVLFNFIFLKNFSSQIHFSNNQNQFIKENHNEVGTENLQSASDTSMLESPFIIQTIQFILRIIF